MSRPYRVTVRESLQRTVVAEDSVKTRLEVLPLLGEAETQEILKRTLKERGFEEDGDKMSREKGKIRTEIDPATGDVEVSSKDSRDIDESAEGDLPNSGCGCAVRAKEALRQNLRDNLKNIANQKERDLQVEVTNRLEGALQGIACELERIANQVTGTSLRRRAQQLGQIKSITHDNEKGELTIVVEV